MTGPGPQRWHLPDPLQALLFWSSLFLLVTALIIVTHSYWPLPIFWDEAVPYTAPALRISREGLWHLLPGYYDSRIAAGHPQGFLAFLALALRIFGENREVLRVLMTVISCGSLVLAALVGRQIGGGITGFLSALLLLCSRDFLSRSYHVLPDSLLIFLCLASVYATFREKPFLAFALAASFAALVKETAFAFLAICALAQLWHWRRSLTAPRIALVLLPLLMLPLFFILEKIRWGQFTNFPFTDTFVGSFAEYWRNWKNYAHYFSEYSLDGLFFLVLLAAFGGGAAFFRERFNWRVLVLLGIPFCLLSGIAFLSAVNFRYLSPAIPMISLLIAWGVRQLFIEASLRVLVVVSALVVFRPDYFHVFPNTAFGAPEHSLAYGFFLRETQSALLKLAAKHPDGKIATSWPYNEVMRDSFYGFVEKGRETTLEPAKAEFVLIATAMSLDERLRLERWVEMKKPKLLERIDLKPAGAIWWFRNR